MTSPGEAQLRSSVAEPGPAPPGMSSAGASSQRIRRCAASAAQGRSGGAAGARAPAGGASCCGAGRTLAAGARWS
jgi:hypothetical protein